jgi:hypothetical protein
MKYIYALFYSLSLFTGCTASDWPAFVVDEHLTVRLPKKPAPVDLRGMRFPSAATQ